MLRITVPEIELFDQSTDEFITIKRQNLSMEHSLVSISKWESKWKKPYLYNQKKTLEEEVDYLRCMTITQNVDPMIFRYLPKELYSKINDYVNDPMTATTINDISGKRGGTTIVTSELIYYWMTVFNIPFDCEKWHLNRLLTLIKICEIKQRDPKTMSRSEILARNRAINEERKKKYNTKG